MGMGASAGDSAGMAGPVSSRRRASVCSFAPRLGRRGLTQKGHNVPEAPVTPDLQTRGKARRRPLHRVWHAMTTQPPRGETARVLHHADSESLRPAQVRAGTSA